MNNELCPVDNFFVISAFLLYNTIRRFLTLTKNRGGRNKNEN